MPGEYSVLRDGLFAGRTALVTGAGRGMGRDIALRFAGLGANVIATGRHIETLEETGALIRSDGGAVPAAYGGYSRSSPDRCAG